MPFRLCLLESLDPEIQFDNLSSVKCKHGYISHLLAVCKYFTRFWEVFSKNQTRSDRIPVISYSDIIFLRWHGGEML
jgi:hypothetical protein